MNTQRIYGFFEFSTEQFNYCPKRENFLNTLINRWKGVKFAMKDKDPKDIEFYKNLSDEEKVIFSQKLSKAMDLRNEIFNRRKLAIQKHLA